MEVRSACLALAVYLPLAVCSQSLAAPAQDTPITNLNAPRVKAGLWRHVMVIDGRQGSGIECDAGRPLIAPRQGDCSKFEGVRTAGGKILFESVCKVGSVTTTLRSSYKGDFSSAFATDVVIDQDEAGQVSNRVTGNETYQYLGSCPSGMEPDG